MEFSGLASMGSSEINPLKQDQSIKREMRTRKRRRASRLATRSGCDVKNSNRLTRLRWSARSRPAKASKSVSALSSE